MKPKIRTISKTTVRYEPIFAETNLSSTTDSTGRYYETPVGLLPSVTTVLGKSLDKSGLEAWRNMIGDEEADQILRTAGSRGTTIHDLMEKYVLGNDDVLKGVMPFNEACFRKIAKAFDREVSSAHAVEKALWSKTLKTAGRTDVVVTLKSGKKAIGDFKTSRKKKTENEIEGYFVQTTAYSLMLEERTGFVAPYVAIFLAPDHEPDCQVFIRPRSFYLDRVEQIFITDRTKNNI